MALCSPSPNNGSQTQPTQPMPQEYDKLTAQHPKQWDKLTTEQQHNLCGWFEVTGNTKNAGHGERINKNDTVLLKDGENLTITSTKDECIVFTFHSMDTMRQSKMDPSTDFQQKVGAKYWVTDEPLGSGSFANVYIAVTRDTMERCAVKVMKRDAFPSNIADKSGTNYLREVEPNIIKLYDFIETEQYIYLFMQLASGGDLFSYVRDKRCVPEQEAKFIAYQLLMGLRCIHAQGVSHRDIKPENILLLKRQQNPHVLITDFGMAKDMDEMTARKHTVCGTYHYLAPEVIVGTMKGDHKKDDKLQTHGYGREADLWSIGVVIYVMLSGTMAFGCSGDEIRDTISRVLHHSVEFPREEWNRISLQARHFIACLLRRHPADRMTVKEAIAHPWFLDDAEELEELYADVIGDHIKAPDAQPSNISCSINTGYSSENSQAVVGESPAMLQESVAAALASPAAMDNVSLPWSVHADDTRSVAMADESVEIPVMRGEVPSCILEDVPHTPTAAPQAEHDANHGNHAAHASPRGTLPAGSAGRSAARRDNSCLDASPDLDEEYDAMRSKRPRTGDHSLEEMRSVELLGSSLT
ncbi:kinase-like domain-containing protein [Thamnocephalis sphaerospora]|uniref:Kinase-like domain-containing protein n=1 Tax=Thamnocephalis sphaerospora TaxID=78915 RepID=A0A4P9XLK0_9FUNG|nr:kinase-like domain-containing protein [Thamnocephalis sphaerospora]|eukprot:RKP06695.1 kinase-like domain-containing protein [Thamnocephalis sphaerospora]